MESAPPRDQLPALMAASASLLDCRLEMRQIRCAAFRKTKVSSPSAIRLMPSNPFGVASVSVMARPFRLESQKPAGSSTQTSVSGTSGSAMMVMPRPLISLTTTAT